MKKFFCACFALWLTLPLTACTAPDALQLDLSQGCGLGLKLLHLNASTQERRQRIEEFAAVWEDAQPLDKDIALFAYYPDYRLEVRREGQSTQALVDLNGAFLDFHYVGQDQVYRSAMTAEEFKAMLHRVED